MKRARYFRKKATDCERVLWRRFRNRNFAGYKFRRQHPIDPYILDFYCPATKLALEIDGSGHGYLLRETRDHARDEFLASMGIAVLRFWRSESDLVRAWGTLPEKSLTFILSLSQRERRSRGDAELLEAIAQIARASFF